MTMAAVVLDEEDVQDKLIQEAKALIWTNRRAGNNGVAVHIRKDEPLKVSTGPCHGFIRNAGSERSVAIVTHINRLSASNDKFRERAEKTQDLHVTFYDWVFNRSPWAFCFTTKDAAQAVEERACVVRVDVPANMLQGALITTRNMWEHSPNIQLWDKLVKAGIEENKAFVMSMAVSPVDNGREVFLRGLDTDHLAICSDIRMDGLEAFLQGSPLYTTGDYNRSGDYQGVKRAFKGEGERVSKILKEGFQRSLEDKSKVALNPFIKAKRVSRGDVIQVKFEDFVSIIKDSF